MKTTNFKIEERKLNKLNSVPYMGELNVDTFHFEFDDEWAGLEKTLVIIAEDKTYNVALLNDEAVLPTEAYIDNKSISIGVFGKKDNTILSTNLIDIWITKGAYAEGQEPSNLPTPTQWDLYIAEINRLLDEANASKEECERILEEMTELKEKVEKAEQGVDAFNKNATEKTNQFDKNAADWKNTINKAGQDNLEAVNSAGTQQVKDINTAGTKAIENIETAETEAINKIQTEGESYDARITKLENKVDQAENILPTQTASGENVYVDNAVKYQLMSLKGEGKSKQFTTTGKNIIDLTQLNTISSPIKLKGSACIIEDKNINSMILKSNGTWSNASLDFEENYFQEDEDIVMSAKFLETISGRTSQLGFTVYGSNDGSTYDTIKTNSANKINYNVTTKISLTANVGTYKYIRIRIWSNATGTSVTEGESIINVSELMVAKGVDDTFEPYTGGQASPNPDYPQEITTIETYNFLPKTTQPSQKINGIDFTVNENGTIIANGTATAKATFYLGNQTTLKPDTYTLSSGLNGVSGVRFGVEINGVYYNTNTSRTEKFTSKASITSIYFQIDSGITVENLTLYPAISKGNSYVPYGSLLYKGIGKNVIGLGIPLNGYTDNSTLKFYKGTNSVGYYFETSKLPNTITISAVNGNRANVSYYDEEIVSGTQCKLNNPSTATPHLPRTIEVDKTYKYIHIQFSYNVADVSEIQVEEGTVATEYEPYQETTLPIDLQGNELCKVGEVADKLLIDRKGNVAIEKNIEKVMLDGTQTITYFNAYQNIHQFLINISKQAIYINSSTIISIISDFFKGVAWQSSWTKDNSITIGGEKKPYVMTSKFTTVEEFKAWLQENNTTVYYVLETPEIINLGTIENPEIFKGINNIVVETNLGNMAIDVEYVEDIQKRIDTEIGNCQSQIDEIKELLSSGATSAMLLDNLESDLEIEVM